MKKRMLSLLLTVCMLLGVSVVAHAYDYDYTIDRKYTVECRMFTTEFQTMGTLFVPCGSPEITLEYKWTTDPAFPYNEAWVLHVNGQKIPHQYNDTYGWTGSKGLATATGIADLTGFEYVNKAFAVITDGVPSPLKKSFTVPSTGNGTGPQVSFYKNSVNGSFSIKFQDKNGYLLTNIPTYTHRFNAYGMEEINWEDVGEHLLKNGGYYLTPRDQSAKVKYYYDASTGKTVFDPPEVIFTVDELLMGVF